MHKIKQFYRLFQFCYTVYWPGVQDLMDTESGVLGEWLGGVLDTWREHITSCLLCKAKAGQFTYLYNYISGSSSSLEAYYL